MDRGNQPTNNSRISGIEPDDTNSINEHEQSEPIGADTNRIGTDQSTVDSVAENSTTPNETKRSRGRPKGSTKANGFRTPTTDGTNEETTTFTISEKRKVGKRPTKSDDRKLYTADEARTTAKIILGMVQAIGVSIAGNEAVFNQMEDTLLSESLPPLLERLSVSSAEKTANILYPLCIGFASVSYGIRVYRLQKEKNQPITNEVAVPENWNESEETNHSNGTPSLNPFQQSRRV